ncbi:tripartite tricarboxylate transporter substrate-binding protein [Roseateles sp.]|uniref:tripartite tricarboxylate transporter substrate-binding protein n=1 Tax=Roseateles sp. TaxID=1971397 RepID=UPI0032642D47
MTELTRRDLLQGLAGAALAAAQPLQAAPDGVLRLLCSGPAGSIPDIVARALSEPLALALGRRVIVDNRPGAAGQLSVGALKAAPADGSTLLVAQGAIATVYPALYTHLAYDPDVDLKPVSLASEMPLALAVGPAVPSAVATLADFIAWLRGHPAAANIGSPGAGTLPHLLEAMLFSEVGVAWQHVTYSGGPPAVNDLLGGQIAALVLPEGLLRQHHATGRLRVLATSGAARSAYLPEVPTFAEQGHPGLVVKEWFAVFAPGGTPSNAVAGLAAALQTALGRPEIEAVFSKAGMTPLSCSPAALTARIGAEQRYWKPVLQAHGIRAD